MWIQTHFNKTFTTTVNFNIKLRYQTLRNKYLKIAQEALVSTFTLKYCYRSRVPSTGHLGGWRVHRKGGMIRVVVLVSNRELDSVHKEEVVDMN